MFYQLNYIVAKSTGASWIDLSRCYSGYLNVSSFVACSVFCDFFLISILAFFVSPSFNA